MYVSFRLPSQIKMGYVSFKLFRNQKVDDTNQSLKTKKLKINYMLWLTEDD
jgi:hypothetical protein